MSATVRRAAVPGCAADSPMEPAAAAGCVEAPGLPGTVTANAWYGEGGGTLPQHGGSASSDESEPEPPVSRSRRVSFADAFGLDLVSVKEFSSVPLSAVDIMDLNGQDSEEYVLCSQFSVPASEGELLQKLEEQKCELECIELLPGTTSLRGIIRVLNLCFSKRVYVRTTLDSWTTHFDLLAEFIPGSSDGRTDQFTFNLTLMPPFQQEGARMEFCLRYETSVGTFWTNNNGLNYVLVCHQRGGREGRGNQHEDNGHRNKKSCLKPISKDKPTETNPTVISAETADVPTHKQEVIVSKISEKSAPRSEGLQEDSGQKPLVDSGRNVSRRSRRRAARLARVRDLFTRATAEVQKGDTSAGGSKSTETRGVASDFCTHPPEGVPSHLNEACDRNSANEKEQALMHDQIPLLSPHTDREGSLLFLTEVTDTSKGKTHDFPFEIRQDLPGPCMDMVQRSEKDSTEAFVNSEEKQAAVCTPAEGNPAYQGPVWNSLLPHDDLWNSSGPKDTPRCWRATQATLWGSADSLIKVVIGHPGSGHGSFAAPGNSESPQVREEDASIQELTVTDITSSVLEFPFADVTPSTQEFAIAEVTTSMPEFVVSGSSTNEQGLTVPDDPTSVPHIMGSDITEGEVRDQGIDTAHERGDTDPLWPQTDLFKFETFVAPLYHQAYIRMDTDIQDVTVGLPAGDETSEDSDDETQTGSTAHGSSLTGMPDIWPLLPDSSYMQRKHQHRGSSENLESALEMDITASKQEGQIYAQEGCLPSLSEIKCSGVEVISHDHVHPATECKSDVISQESVCGAEVISHDHVHSAPEHSTQHMEQGKHLFTVEAVEGLQISGDTTVKTDKTNMTATLVPSNNNAADKFLMEDCNRIAYLAPLANTEAENKGHELRGNHMTFGQGLNERGDHVTEGEGAVFTEEEQKRGQSSGGNKEDHAEKTDISKDNEKDLTDLDRVVLVKKANTEDNENISAEKEEEIEEISLENEDPYGKNSIENEYLDNKQVLVNTEDHNDVSVENEGLYGEHLTDNEDLDDNEVLVCNEGVENEGLYGEQLTDNEDLDDNEVFAHNEGPNEGVENEGLYGEHMTDNKDLDDNELSAHKEGVEIEGLYDEHLTDNVDLDENEVLVNNEGPNQGVEYDGLNSENLTENEDLDDNEVLVNKEGPNEGGSVENEGLYGENLTENEDIDDNEVLVNNESLDECVSLENYGLEGSENIIKTEDLDEIGMSLDDGVIEGLSLDDDDDNIGIVGEEDDTVIKDLDEAKSETSTERKEDQCCEEEEVLRGLKGQFHDKDHEEQGKRKGFDEGVGELFMEEEHDLSARVRTDSLVGKDDRLEKSSDTFGTEKDGGFNEGREAFNKGGSESRDKEDLHCRESSDHEAEEDSASTESLTDDEMELHMHCLKSAHQQLLAQGAPGKCRDMSVSVGKRPSVSKARVPPSRLSSISESLNEDGDTGDSFGIPQDDHIPAEKPRDPPTIKLPPVEKVENVARSYLFLWGGLFSFGHLSRTFLYTLLCVVFFFTAYHYDFMACFALYLFSVYWLCFHGEKQRLKEANRIE